MKALIMSIILLLASVIANAAFYDNGTGYDYYAQSHINSYGVSSSYLAGIDSALSSARSFLGQDIAKQMPRSSGSYGVTTYSPYYSPYYYSPYYSPYYYWSWW